MCVHAYAPCPTHTGGCTATVPLSSAYLSPVGCYANNCTAWGFANLVDGKLSTTFRTEAVQVSLGGHACYMYSRNNEASVRSAWAVPCCGAALPALPGDIAHQLSTLSACPLRTPAPMFRRTLPCPLCSPSPPRRPTLWRCSTRCRWTTSRTPRTSPSVGAERAASAQLAKSGQGPPDHRN